MRLPQQFGYLKRMALVLNKLKLRQIMIVSARYKSRDHWARQRKKQNAKDRALEHFNDFYASIYADHWSEIRDALLNDKCKYIAVVNNFSDTERIRSDMQSFGAIHLKDIYDSQKENLDTLKTEKNLENFKSPYEQNTTEVEISKDRLAEIQAFFPPEYPNISEALKAEDNKIDEEVKRVPIELKSIDESLADIDLDASRIINSSVNLSTLNEYVPATKIKGMEDWISESEHYKFYNRAADFKVEIEKEFILPFPEHLHAYTFERESDSRFPSPKMGSTGVLDYYLFDGASILPVLALDIRLGDYVLDMCAAPGGKALTILQTLMPRLLVANDNVQSRVRKLQSVMDQFFANVYNTENMLRITERDARKMEEKDIYDKILVDVPCTTDRHILHTDDNNIFKPTRVKERLRMPEVQSEILTNALNLVKVGGTVVYSTCCLSPIQNDGVVHVALKKAWEENNAVMVVKDMTEALLPLEYLFKFANIALKYGHIAVPTLQNNWGPMYFCKIVRIQ